MGPRCYEPYAPCNSPHFSLPWNQSFTKEGGQSDLHPAADLRFRRSNGEGGARHDAARAANRVRLTSRSWPAAGHDLLSGVSPFGLGKSSQLLHGGSSRHFICKVTLNPLHQTCARPSFQDFGSSGLRVGRLIEMPLRGSGATPVQTALFVLEAAVARARRIPPELGTPTGSLPLEVPGAVGQRLPEDL